jgi:hypothetical protein
MAFLVAYWHQKPSSFDPSPYSRTRSDWLSLVCPAIHTTNGRLLEFDEVIQRSAIAIVQWLDITSVLL